MAGKEDSHAPTLLYLDQNYASRVSKFLLGQPSHEPFGVLYEALEPAQVLIPPSPFHVLELRGGYLLPSFRSFYARFSRGLWVRPWAEVVRRQAARGGLARDDLLSSEGDWDTAAELSPLEDILDLGLAGGFQGRTRSARHALYERLNLGLDFSTDEGAARTPPFVWLLSRMLAFRSLERERYTRPSDLTDFVMAATVGPYVDILATDRYMREVMGRVGHGSASYRGGEAYSGRRHEVLALAARLKENSHQERRSSC